MISTFAGLECLRLLFIEDYMRGLFLCMRFSIMLMVIWAAIPSPVMGSDTTNLAASDSVIFYPLDIYIDPHDEPLAAYQFELRDETQCLKIVGVEGGDHPAFKAPPYYDPKALSENRIIIAAFSTESDLPRDKTRVATIHVVETGNRTPQISVELAVAASSDGSRIEASVSVVKGEEI